MPRISTHFSDYLAGYDNQPFSPWQPIHTSPTAALTPTKQPPAENPRQWPSRPYFCESLARLCEESLGGRVNQIDFPGGDDRGACRVYWEDGRTVIASYRDEYGRGKLEERVLHHLQRQLAPTPKVLHYNGLLLLQEDLSGERLSTILATADTDHCHALLARALQSLSVIHHAAELEGLDQQVPVLGCEDTWIARHLRQVRKISKALELVVPEVSGQDLRDILFPLRPRFIKWDARPGNAIVRENGDICWFDWEHCGARNRLDDLVWLLCDENTPFSPDTDQALLAEHIPAFADGLPLEAAYRYAYIAGALHCAARLGLILYRKDGEDWWDAQEIIDFDYIGVSLPLAQRLCRRAADWAKREPLVAPLSDWFQTIGGRLESL